MKNKKFEYFIMIGILVFSLIVLGIYLIFSSIKKMVYIVYLLTKVILNVIDGNVKIKILLETMKENIKYT